MNKRVSEFFFTKYPNLIFLRGDGWGKGARVSDFFT